MTIVVLSDNLTPHLKKLKGRIKRESIKTANRVLKKGKNVAKAGVQSQRSKDLYNNIVMIPATSKAEGYLLSGSKRSTSGFPYELWVNRDLKQITGRKPFFNDGIRVGYGDGRVKANWRMTPRYFTLAVAKMRKMLPKEMRRMVRKLK